MIKKFCILGDASVDFFTPDDGAEAKLRLGGIMHSARALWALDCNYVMGFVSPAYLDEQVFTHAIKYAGSAKKVGNVTGSPNVLVVGSPKEEGPQQYDYLLRDEKKTHFDFEALNELVESSDISDYLIYPSEYDLGSVLECVGKSAARVFIDLTSEASDTGKLCCLGRKFESIVTSTSTPLFQERQHDITGLVIELLQYSSSVVIKENRGGSRLFSLVDGKLNEIITPAQLRPIQHSVGVGDCFNAVFAYYHGAVSDEAAMAYSSLIAADYAFTTYPEDFKQAVQRDRQISPSQIIELGGVSLPWDKRRNFNIYIAAPDFDFIDRREIDRLAECLRYHNFTPRLPIRENGQMGPKADAARKESLFNKDMELLSECQILVAVHIYNDPGTLIEIGLASAMGKPVIVYDPEKGAENLILTQLPQLISSNLDEVVSGVFDCAWRLSENV